MSDIITRIAHIIDERPPIDPRLYLEYRVKRGLRNEDGTGVLVGLTEIGNVYGYRSGPQGPEPDHGVLRYRGIDVTELVDGFVRENRPGYEETVYLLLTGELPDAATLAEFQRALAGYRQLPDGFAENMILRAPSRDVMNKLGRQVLVSYGYDPDPETRDLDATLRTLLRQIARMPVMVAYAYQARQRYFEGESMYLHRPLEGGSSAENLLHLIRPDSAYTALEAQVLDLAMVLHAEHGGGNNSSFTVHVVTSSGTDCYSAIAAAIGSLKGRKHGGANERVVGMMDDLFDSLGPGAREGRVSEGDIADYLRGLLRRERYDRQGLIYGIGHAVYTLSDPRARVLREHAETLAEAQGMSGEFAVYRMVEELAPRLLAEGRALPRPVAANVDFYSGFVYRMLGIPDHLFTPIFAVSRSAGWAAHLLEELHSGGKIMRPAYRHVGEERHYAPLSER